MIRAAIRGAVVVALLLFATPLSAAPPGDDVDSSAAADRAAWRRVLLLEDYNTRVVLASTTMLGLAAGAVGSFALLRKRALLGDALSHATLPGIGFAFLVVTAAGGDGKALPVLLAGAAASGVLGIGAIMFIRRFTRLKEDAALGIVLSVFFGAGIALLDVSQKLQAGNAAGLESFIYGKVASMSAADARWIAAAGAATLACSLLLFKELKLLCFDDAFAAAAGWPVTFLDSVLMALIVGVTIVGLQSVGLILMVSLLVTPAAAARFWVRRMAPLTVIAAGIGAASGFAGAAASAILPRLPSGAIIVLTATVLFGLSMALGTERGVVVRWLRRREANRRIERQHLLRAAYEILESRGLVEEADPASIPPIELAELLPMRSWSPAALRRIVERCELASLAVLDEQRGLLLTKQGFKAAKRITHEHRLWELYLLTHADIAPSKVDRDADAIEHALEPEMIEELERLLEQRQAVEGVALSPHPVGADDERGPGTDSAGGG